MQLELITKKLLECEDPNGSTDTMESSLLNVAVLKRNVEVVKILLSNGAQIDVKDRYGYTPLMNAVEMENRAIVELLIEKGASRLATTVDQKTLLHLAAGVGDPVLVKRFISEGLTVDVQDRNGWTPLHEAAFFGSEDVAEVLLEKGEIIKIYFMIGLKKWVSINTFILSY